jgi:hypothetical protein
MPVPRAIPFIESCRECGALKQVWRYDLSPTAKKITPIVVDGVLYGGQRKVVA